MFDDDDMMMMDDVDVMTIMRRTSSLLTPPAKITNVLCIIDKCHMYQTSWKYATISIIYHNDLTAITLYPHGGIEPPSVVVALGSERSDARPK